MRSLRVTAGFTVRQLAVKTGIHPSTIRRIEGGSGAKADTLKALSEVLQTPRVEPKIRMRVRPPEPEPIPHVVGKLLATGRLGAVSERELRLLIKASRDPDYNDLDLLELYFCFRRACSRMHKRRYKRRFDETYDRIRKSLLEMS